MKNHDKSNWVILEIIRDYLYSYINFQSFYEKYKKGALTFENDVEKFINDKDTTLPLYSLKQSCHMFFRYQEGGEISDEEKLFDLAIGSIFHEAMKIRESLYMLQVYKPRFMQIGSDKVTSDHERHLLREFKKMGIRTERRLAESMSEVRRLFKETLEQLTGFLPRYKDNPVLIRFLLRNKDLLQRAFGERKGLKIISDLFPGGLGEAYDVEGRSYLRSEHYDLATDFFRQALRYRPEDRELKVLYLFSRGMDGYFKNKYQETLRNFHRLLPLIGSLEDGGGYRQMAEEVCRKIGRAYLEDKKKKLGMIALQLAETIKGVPNGPVASS
jgi:tetratricopeptide (TPR) repeat protein